MLFRSLRDELESLRFEKDAAVQQAIQRSTDEITQLKDTSSSLRQSLESQRFDFEALLQQQKKENVDENSHLEKTIETLREKLEKCDAK